MTFEKQSLMESGDNRVLLELLQKFHFTLEEVTNAINIYEPYQDNHIPEVEHIEIILAFYPNAHISHNTMKAIIHSFPHRLQHILHLQQRYNNQH